MEKIKQQIEETKEEIKTMRLKEDNALYNNSSVEVCNISRQINYKIAFLNGLRFALNELEKETPLSSNPSEK